MKLDVVRDGKYLALVVDGTLTLFVLRNAEGVVRHSELVSWIDSQNQLPKDHPMYPYTVESVADGLRQIMADTGNEQLEKIRAEKFDAVGEAHRASKQFPGWEKLVGPGNIENPPRSPAFETVEDTQRRAHAEELRSIAYVLDEAGVPKTACGGEGDAEVRINLCERIRCLVRQRNDARHIVNSNKRPKGQENASISKIPDSPTTRHAYTRGDVMPHSYAPLSKTIGEGGRVYQWENYPRDVFRTPKEWAEWFACYHHDSKGWEGPNGQSIALPVNITEFLRRSAASGVIRNNIWNDAYRALIQEPLLNRNPNHRGGLG